MSSSIDEGLVERTPQYGILLHLPGAHSADKAAAAMIHEMGKLPVKLLPSVTRDRGTELTVYARMQNALELTLFLARLEGNFSIS